MQALPAARAKKSLCWSTNCLAKPQSYALCAPVGALSSQCDRRQNRRQGIAAAPGFLRRTRARRPHRDLSVKRIWLGTCKSCCARTANSAIAEQRFHLELGLLKMAHAQRLLPLEQLLSEAAASQTSSTHARRTAGSRVTFWISRRPSGSSADVRRTETAARSNSVSPFAADTARKSVPKPSRRRSRR